MEIVLHPNVKRSIKMYTDAGFKVYPDGTRIAVGSALISFKPGGSIEIHREIPEANSSQQAELLVILEGLREIYTHLAKNGQAHLINTYDLTLYTDNKGCERFLTPGADIPEKYVDFYADFFKELDLFKEYKIICISKDDYKKIKWCDSMCNNLIKKLEKKVTK